LVCKVHPEYNLSEKVWKSVDEIDENSGKQIRKHQDFEKHLARNGTKIVKIFFMFPKKSKKTISRQNK
jgi:polyphosphate kinase 2 (PPK2 family)